MISITILHIHQKNTRQNEKKNFSVILNAKHTTLHGTYILLIQRYVLLFKSFFKLKFVSVNNFFLAKIGVTLYD